MFFDQLIDILSTIYTKIYPKNLLVLVFYTMGWTPIFIINIAIPDGFDKYLHFCSFLGASCLLYFVFKPIHKYLRLFATILISISVAVLSEVVQPVFPNRYFDSLDILANLLGVCVIIATITEHYRGTRRIYRLVE